MLGCLVAVAALTITLAAAEAGATTITSTNGVRVSGGDLPNDLLIEAAGVGEVRFTERGAGQTITTTSELCTISGGGTVATCTLPYERYYVDTGDCCPGWYEETTDVYVDGQGGNDVVDASTLAPLRAGWVRVTGGDGDDELIVNGNIDTTAPGMGDDVVREAAPTEGGTTVLMESVMDGADIVSNVGSVKYPRTSDVLVDLRAGAPATDGAAGEGDDIRGEVDEVHTGSGADVVWLGTLAGTVAPGRGADVVHGGPGNDTIRDNAGVDADRFYGGDGDDTIHASAFTSATNVVYGQGGNDHLVGKVAHGGLGNDSINSTYGFGGPGNDRVRAVSARGGAGDDHIDAKPGGGAGQPAESALGEAGRDVVNVTSGTARGGDGNDTVTGKVGSTIHGDGGNDTMRVAGGTAFGGDGNDLIIGAARRSITYGGAGADNIFLGDADGPADVANCGPGADIVRNDAVDVTRGCERRVRSVLARDWPGRERRWTVRVARYSYPLAGARRLALAHRRNGLEATVIRGSSDATRPFIVVSGIFSTEARARAHVRFVRLTRWVTPGGTNHSDQTVQYRRPLAR